MTYRSAVLIGEAVLAEIEVLANVAWPRETGGILLGVKARTGPWVTRAIEVRTDLRTTHSFQLPPNVTPRLVAEARIDDSRLGYLGDWHSHPARVEASETDRVTMRRLARRLQRRHVLIVAMRSVDGYEFDVRVVGQLGDKRAKLVRTGPLEPEETT